MTLASWLRLRRNGRVDTPPRRRGASREDIHLADLLHLEHGVLSQKQPTGDNALPTSSTPPSTTGEFVRPEPTITAGEAAIEASVRGTQEFAERRFIKALANGGRRLQQDAWQAAEARRLAGLATADPVGQEAHRIAAEESIKALKTFDEKHEPGAGPWLLLVLVALAFLGDLGFLYSIFARSIRDSDPWWVTALAIGMSLALAAVSVALADLAGRQLRPLWSGGRGEKVPALLRASVPLTLTVVASFATWQMVQWRFEQVSPGVITRLPAGLIATFVVALLWMILVLESQRPSAVPMVDPRVQKAADKYVAKRDAATAATVQADMKHDDSWLSLADQVDQTLTAIQEVYVPGAHIVLEHRATHGIEHTPLLAAPDTVDNTEDDFFPARFTVPEILQNSRLVGRKFHHLERALGLLRAHQPAGMNGAQTIVERLYSQLDRVIAAQRNGGFTLAERGDNQHDRHRVTGKTTSEPGTDPQTIPFVASDLGRDVVRQNHHPEDDG